MQRGLLIILLLLSHLAYPFLAIAAITGKIKGKIIDKQTNEALAGANVVVTGTSLGSASDINGEFIILGVPAGTHELEGRFLGYQPLRITDIQVSPDLTTEVDFQMTPLSEGVALQEIVIQRPRALISKYATNTVRIQTRRDIENLPIRHVIAAIALNPGIVQQDGRLHIRGGRAEEVGYYLEGARAGNVFGRDLSDSATANQIYGTTRDDILVTVIPEALEEFQILTGGYSAQYGVANSGIVRLTLRSGGPQYKASLLLETDNFTGQHEKRLGTFSYGYSNYVATLSGPIVTEKIKFFIAGENQFDRDWRRVFWEGFRFENLPDANSDPVSRENGFDDMVDLLEVKPGNTPGMFQNRYTGNGSITFDYNPLIVRVAGSITWKEKQGTALVIPSIFNLRRLPITESSSFLVNTKITHIVSPQFLYEVNLSYNDNRSKRYDPDFGDDILLYSDSLANAPLGYKFRSYTAGPGTYRLYGFPFTRFGEPEADFNKRQQLRLGGSFDLTLQLGSHEFKAGGSVDAYTLRRFNLSGHSRLLSWYRNHPDEARIAGEARDFAVAFNGGVNNYGYDFYGNKLDSGIDGPKKPRFYAAYLQDKIEYKDLVINAGLRLDVFDTDDFIFVDDPTTLSIEGPDNPSIDPNTKFYRETGIKKAESITVVSPRLGLAFPATDKTVFHAQFGTFFQPPAFSNIYVARH
ncbi:MAG: carboxypeptidase-like regulatory domain-containing protein, partial [Ignavibacteria bacterium]|nr:carboxypeptidase-like regulatory domain-containing protein [Ignavibacteria bacterium]